MNRHIIIRAIIAVICIIAGIAQLVSKDNTMMGIVSLVLGAAFGYSAFMMTKKK